MSIKTFPERPGGGSEKVLIFLAFSLALHLLVLAFASYLGPVADSLLRKKEKEPLLIDVVELPPGAGVAPGKPTVYGDRDNSVKREVLPERRGRFSVPERRVPVTPLRPAVPGERGNGAPGKAEKKVEGKAGAHAGGVEKGLEASRPRSGPPVDIPKGNGTKGEVQTETVPVERPQSIPKVEGGGGGGASKALPGKKPNLFLSDERIAELSRKYEAEAPKGEKGKALQLNTSELKFQRYIISNKPKVYLHWEYPEIAVRNNWQGRLFIDFTIQPDGRLTDITLVKSSGFPALDDAAITALRLASPFSPFPKEFVDIPNILIHAEFEYITEGRPARQ